MVQHAKHSIISIMSKPPASWALRYKSPVEFPDVAKFSDVLNWDEAQHPVHMYLNKEELREDEIPTTERDSEYYRRKRERRRSYQKKNTFILEDSANHEGNHGQSAFRFEGKICNLGLADIEEAKSKAAEVTEAPFRYVLLQFVKKEGDGENGSTSEINVIPVGDMYAFKKATKRPDELLADIDERFIEEMQRSKGNISRYKGINKSLTAAERSRLGLKPEGEAGGDGRREGLNSKEFLGGFGSSSLFGASVNKTVAKRRADKAGESGEGGGGSFLNENGVDMDELRDQDNMNSGDYSTRFVDDEEEYVTVEQSRNQAMAEKELSGAQRYAAELDEEAEDSAGESTEDEQEEERLRARAEDERGMVDDSMVSNAAEARRLFISRPNLLSSTGNGSSAAIAAVVGKPADSQPGPVSAGTAKSALKRPRDEAFKTDAPLAKQAAEGQSGKASRVSFTDSTPAKAPTAVGRADEYPLTEQGLRLFMQHRGGKVPPGDMNYFKPQLKADKSAKKRFYDIVVNLTEEVEDPLLGKVLVLKHSK